MCTATFDFVVRGLTSDQVKNVFNRNLVLITQLGGTIEGGGVSIKKKKKKSKSKTRKGIHHGYRGPEWRPS